MTDRTRAARLAAVWRILAGVPELLADRLPADVAKALDDALAAGRAGEIAECLANVLVHEVEKTLDYLSIPPSWSTEGECRRCGGIGRIGVTYVARHTSVQWEDRPSECIDPERCNWPYDLPENAE
jgi:hypothetical protein